MVGYRATVFKPGAPSMLGGLGAAVARSAGSFPDRARAPPRETVADARARGKGTHLFDQVPGSTPGYTGRAAR